jgi:hypothetical protein
MMAFGSFAFVRGVVRGFLRVGQRMMSPHRPFSEGFGGAHFPSRVDYIV